MHCGPLRLQICACCLEKPPSSAIGVVNEVCSRALVGSLTKAQNGAIPFTRGVRCEVADFSSCQHRHVKAASLHVTAAEHF